MAFGASLIGYVRSMAAVIFPVSMSSSRTSMSSWFSLETDVVKLLTREPGRQGRR